LKYLVPLFLIFFVVSKSSAFPSDINNSFPLNDFGNMVGDSKIVALGESNHTNGSFQQVNVKLARYLIEIKGFRILLIETPWSQAKKLNEYISCSVPQIPIIEGLVNLFPQFISVEMAELYLQVKDFNCKNPNDQVRVYGFDTQQAAFGTVNIGQNADLLIEFIEQSATSFLPKVEDLKRCGPNHDRPIYKGPSSAEDLEKCQTVLVALLSEFNKYPELKFELEMAAIVLNFSASQVFSSSTKNKLAYNIFRDRGMSKMVQHIINSSAPNAKTIVIGHTAHVARDFQKLSHPLKKSMGSYLNEYYGENYFVSVTASYQSAKAAWWKGEVGYVANSSSLEVQLKSSTNIETLIDVRLPGIYEAPVEVLGYTNVRMSDHWDSLVFVPESHEMTGYPGIVYPH
jgi:erythromycin esterase-like protein